MIWFSLPAISKFANKPKSINVLLDTPLAAAYTGVVMERALVEVSFMGSRRLENLEICHPFFGLIFLRMLAARKRKLI